MENEMNRRGVFVVSRELIENHPETVRSIMGRYIILQCETMYQTNTIEYTALSPDFDEVQEGVFAPRYSVDIGGNGDNIEFMRIDR
jgi:hypothetical protein